MVPVTPENSMILYDALTAPEITDAADLAVQAVRAQMELLRKLQIYTKPALIVANFNAITAARTTQFVREFASLLPLSFTEHAETDSRYPFTSMHITGAENVRPAAAFTFLTRPDPAKVPGPGSAYDVGIVVGEGPIEKSRETEVLVMKTVADPENSTGLPPVRIRSMKFNLRTWRRTHSAQLRKINDPYPDAFYRDYLDSETGTWRLDGDNFTRAEIASGVHKTDRVASFKIGRTKSGIEHGLNNHTYGLAIPYRDPIDRTPHASDLETHGMWLYFEHLSAALGFSAAYDTARVGYIADIAEIVAQPESKKVDPDQLELF